MAAGLEITRTALMPFGDVTGVHMPLSSYGSSPKICTTSSFLYPLNRANSRSCFVRSITGPRSGLPATVTPALA